MNNKAFTTVELVVSFALTITIAAFLFQIIINLKEVYVKVGVKTNLITKQSLIARQIYRDFNDKVVNNITDCGDKCLSIYFSDGTNKELKVDNDKKILTYGDYASKLISNSYFGETSFNTSTMYEVSGDKNNSILKISIPIYHELYPNENYGIDIVYQYNSSILSFNNVDF